MTRVENLYCRKMYPFRIDSSKWIIEWNKIAVRFVEYEHQICSPFIYIDIPIRWRLGNSSGNRLVLSSVNWFDSVKRAMISACVISTSTSKVLIRIGGATLSESYSSAVYYGKIFNWTYGCAFNVGAAMNKETKKSSYIYSFVHTHTHAFYVHEKREKRIGWECEWMSVRERVRQWKKEKNAYEKCRYKEMKAVEKNRKQNVECWESWKKKCFVSVDWCKKM